MTTIAISIATTLLTYFALEFTAKPVRRFFDLRTETARLLGLFANVSARFKEIRDRPAEVEVREMGEDDSARLKEAEISLREMASRMRAFVQTESFAAWLVGTFFGYNPFKASAGLFGLSNDIGTYGGSRAFQVRTIEQALRLKPLE
jgi:hypothetical protein